METVSTVTIPGLLFLLTLGFGVWLGLSGKPYNGLLLNVHKFIALGAVIVMGIRLYQASQTVAIQAVLIALIVLAILCVVALFTTCAMLSLGKLPYRLMRAIHSLASVLAVIALAATIYLLTGRNL
jgi:hypothetical protein